MPQQNSITSSPRVTSPIASESTLPCSARQDASRSPRAARGRARESRRRARPASQATAPATPGNASFAACDRQVDLLDRREVDRARLLTRRRVVDRPGAARPARVAPLPPIQWLIGLTVLGASTTSVISVPSSRDREERTVTPTLRGARRGHRGAPGCRAPGSTQIDRGDVLLRGRAAAARPCTGSGSATSRRRSRGRATRAQRRGRQDGRMVGRAGTPSRRTSPSGCSALGLAPDDPPAT